jgi:hypothetical protein
MHENLEKDHRETEWRAYSSSEIAVLKSRVDNHEKCITRFEKKVDIQSDYLHMLGKKVEVLMMLTVLLLILVTGGRIVDISKFLG